jgi:hypothetical protein
MTHNLKANVTETTSTGSFPTHPKAQDPFQWAREMIANKTQKENKIPMFYKESLRFLISKLGELSYVNSENTLVGVKCIHANPERTIAKLKQENNIILPIISISQTNSDNDDDRRRTASQVVVEKYWSDSKKRAFRLLSLAPRPVNINYGINIWSKYKGNLDQLVEQIRLLFNPQLVIENEYTNVAMSYINNEVDKSSVDVADRQERIIRRTFDIKVQAYIPNPKFLITSTGEIEEFNAEATLY